MAAQMVTLDASSWKTVMDFYRPLLAALGAPEWHGANVNALVDTMIWSDETNALRPPYTVRIINARNLPSDLGQELRWAEQDLKDARLEFRNRTGRDVEVTFELV
jgi:RNAse (barnase) inhibitor barstar